jgi:hypothetical protein
VSYIRVSGFEGCITANDARIPSFFDHTMKQINTYMNDIARNCQLNLKGELKWYDVEAMYCHIVAAVLGRGLKYVQRFKDKTKAFVTRTLKNAEIRSLIGNKFASQVGLTSSTDRPTDRLMPFRSTPAIAGLSEYEIARLKRIESNKKTLQSLGLHFPSKPQRNRRNDTDGAKRVVVEKRKKRQKMNSPPKRKSVRRVLLESKSSIFEPTLAIGARGKVFVDTVYKEGTVVSYDSTCQKYGFKIDDDETGVWHVNKRQIK